MSDGWNTKKNVDNKIRLKKEEEEEERIWSCMGVAMLKTERDGGRSTSYSLMMSISHDSIRRQRGKKGNRSTVMQCWATPLQKKLTNMGVGHVSAQVVSRPLSPGVKRHPVAECVLAAEVQQTTLALQLPVGSTSYTPLISQDPEWCKQIKNQSVSGI